MRRIGVLASLLALAMLVVVPTATAEKPAPGVTEAYYYLTFDGPDVTFTFQVDAAQGAGVLTVETMDCCIPGDLWVAFLSHGQPTGNDTGTGVGDGGINLFSGAASVNGWSTGTVTISYDSGVDIWGAGMTVKFTYSSNGNGKAKGNTGMIITPLWQ
jgi:hypothetical protein